MLVALIVSFSLSGYVLAMWAQPFTSVENIAAAPQPLGTFTMALGVNNVSDLYSWQVAIVFNSTQIQVVSASSGDFLNASSLPPNLEYSTDTSGLLLLTGCLEGNVPGKTGTGTVATIIFEYYAKDYDLPRIVSNVGARADTWLMNSTPTIIPGGQSLLTLTLTG